MGRRAYLGASEGLLKHLVQVENPICTFSPPKIDLENPLVSLTVRSSSSPWKDRTWPPLYPPWTGTHTSPITHCWPNPFTELWAPVGRACAWHVLQALALTPPRFGAWGMFIWSWQSAKAGGYESPYGGNVNGDSPRKQAIWVAGGRGSLWVYPGHLQM